MKVRDGMLELTVIEDGCISWEYIELCNGDEGHFTASQTREIYDALKRYYDKEDKV